MGTESHGSQKLFPIQILDSCDTTSTILILTDSSAGESEMVKVTAGEFRVFYLLKGGAIMRKRLLVVFILVLLNIGLLTTHAFSDEIPMITKEELKPMLGSPDIVIFDVRLGSDYFSSDSKIKGAIRPDMGLLIWATADQYQQKSVVLYCASANEEQSIRNAKLLIEGNEDLGHEPRNKVYVLKGGWEEWHRANYPTEKK